MDMTIEKVTVLDLFSMIDSGLALDISKNHTGIVMWNGKEIITDGWEIHEYDKTDYHAEYKMRKYFKQTLKSKIQGKHFQYIVVENVFGGENFDTVRKLLTLQTVIDELLDEGVVTTDKFFRWLQPEWASRARIIYKQTGALKSKIETQGLLEHLEFDFYLKHKDLAKARKEDIYFEDICDACGMLLAVVAEEKFKVDKEIRRDIKMSDIKMIYVEDFDNLAGVRDKRIKEEDLNHIDINYKGNLENAILNAVMSNTEDVLCAYIPVNRLGQFGLKRKFKFFESGNGYLIFYYKE